MIAVIPVAGAGTRLRPHTYTQPKPLIPVAGKPILSFIIDQLIDNGITEFVFVVGYLGEKIEEFVRAKYPELTTTFVLQPIREGLGHAVWMARDVLNHNEILIALGDTIIEGGLTEIIESETSSVGIKKVEDPRNFGVAILDDHRNVLDVVEKPSIPKSNLALVGVYKFKESQLLIEALEKNIKEDVRTNGEVHLTDAIARMIKDSGVQIQAITTTNWYDMGKREILLETNAALLKKRGDLAKGTGKHLNTIIIPPVSIAAGANIQNSIVGPNVTIGENAHINYSILQNSIIGNYTLLENVSLRYSIIGSDAVIKGQSQSLNIGDNTEIDLTGA